MIDEQGSIVLSGQQCPTVVSCPVSAPTSSSSSSLSSSSSSSHAKTSSSLSAGTEAARYTHIPPIPTGNANDSTLFPISPSSCDDGSDSDDDDYDYHDNSPYDSTRLLKAISKVQLRALENLEDTAHLFDYLLKQALKLMGCTYGFLGELRFEDSINRTKPYLHMRAVAYKAQIPLTPQYSALFEECQFMNFKFTNMRGIFGQAMDRRRVVVINDLDPTTLPRNHPPIHTFIGIPMMSNGEPIGMVGISNRKGGGFQEERDAGFLKPFVTTCTTLLLSHQNYLKRREAEMHLQEAYHTLEVRVEERTRELKEEIRRRKSSEEALLLEKQRAELAVVQKNQFLASVSHDLRTPLNSIIGVSDILSTTPLTNEQYEYTHLIKISGNVLINLVNDILDFSRLEMKSQTTTEILEYSKFDLLKCIENIMDVSAFKAQERKNVEVINLFNFDSFPKNITLVGDEFRLSTILMNLLSNSAKFTLKGNICLKTEFLGFEPLDQSRKLKLGDSRVRIKFIVEDSGIGMSKEFISKIGTPFSQMRSNQVNNVNGTGLGLVIAKGMTAVMDGTFEVESEIGVGSRFIVTVVLEAITKPQVNHSKHSQLLKLLKQSEKLIDEKRKHTNIIIAEQSAQNLESLKHICYQFGFKSDQIFCTDKWSLVSQAVNQMREHHRNFVVFLDSNLPIKSAKTPPDQPVSYEDLRRQLQLDVAESSNDQRLIVTTYLTKGKHISSHLRLLKPYKVMDVFQRIAKPGEIVAMKNVKDTPILLSEGSDKRLLIVDDNPINQKVLSHILKRLNYCNHDIASSGEEACEMAKKNSYALIFMDIRMGGIDGFEAAKRISQEQQRTTGSIHSKIVPLSAHVFETSDIERCKTNGMLPKFLSKPVSMQEICEFLKEEIGTNS